jgi:hypothetical protein
MQSVPFTANVVFSIYGGVYLIQCYMNKFVSYLGEIGGFLQLFHFLLPKKFTEILLKTLMT